MSTLTCEICNQGSRDGVTVFRVNAKGQPGIWRCRQHMTAPIPPEVDTVVQIIERGEEQK